jgi:hypothetical protein
VSLSGLENVRTIAAGDAYLRGVLRLEAQKTALFRPGKRKIVEAF